MNREGGMGRKVQQDGDQPYFRGSGSRRSFNKARTTPSFQSSSETSKPVQHEARFFDDDGNLVIRLTQGLRSGRMDTRHLRGFLLNNPEKCCNIIAHDLVDAGWALRGIINGDTLVQQSSPDLRLRMQMQWFEGAESEEADRPARGGDGQRSGGTDESSEAVISKRLLSMSCHFKVSLIHDRELPARGEHTKLMKVRKDSAWPKVSGSILRMMEAALEPGKPPPDMCVSFVGLGTLQVVLLALRRARELMRSSQSADFFVVGAIEELDAAEVHEAYVGARNPMRYDLHLVKCEMLNETGQPLSGGNRPRRAPRRAPQAFTPPRGTVLVDEVEYNTMREQLAALTCQHEALMKVLEAKLDAEEAQDDAKELHPASTMASETTTTPVSAATPPPSSPASPPPLSSSSSSPPPSFSSAPPAQQTNVTQLTETPPPEPSSPPQPSLQGSPVGAPMTV